MSWLYCIGNTCFLKLLGKYITAVHAIQEAVYQEFNSVDPFVRRKTLNQRLTDLEEFLKAVLEGGSIGFAQETLSKGFITFAKVRLNPSSKALQGNLIL